MLGKIVSGKTLRDVFWLLYELYGVFLKYSVAGARSIIFYSFYCFLSSPMDFINKIDFCQFRGCEKWKKLFKKMD